MKKIIYSLLTLFLGLVLIGGTCTPDAGPTYTISVTPATPTFGTSVVGYTTPTSQTVTVTNTGTGPVKLSSLPTVTGWTLTPTTPPYFTGTALASGAKATFTIRPNTGLSVGTHSPTITITGSNGASAQVKPTFTVTAALVKTAIVIMQAGEMTEGASDVVTFTVVTTNIADGAYAVTAGNLPGGVTASTSITITSGEGTLTLTGSGATAEGFYDNITLTFTSQGVTSAPFSFSILAPGTETVSVAMPQIGTMTASVPGSVTYNVTTTNIADAPYVATVSNLPTGVTASTPVTITGGSGTLTLTGTSTTEEGTTFPLELTLNGVVSDPFALTIAAAPTYIISASELDPFADLAFGYALPTAETITITNTGTGSVTLNALPTVTNYTLSTLSTTSLATNGAKATFTVRPNAGLAIGTYNQEIVVTGSNGAKASVVASFTVTPPAKAVSVSTPQIGTMTAGVKGSVSYNITTTNIPNGEYEVDVDNLPVNVTVGNSGKVTITANKGALTLDGNGLQAVGNSTLTLKIGGAVSGAFTLVIATAGSKSVDVKPIDGAALVAGGESAVYYKATTLDISNAEYTVTVANLPTGVSVGNSGKVDINNNSGYLLLTGNTTTVAGEYNNLALTIDGATSGTFTLTILPAGTRSVTVGAQNPSSTATLRSFPVTTAGIEDGNYMVTVANLPSGAVVADYGSFNVAIAGGVGVYFGIDVSGATPGVYDNLTLMIDGVVSNPFTLVVGTPTPTVKVGTQVGKMTAKMTGTVTYPITTTGIDADTYPMSVTTYVSNRPTGVTVLGDVTIGLDGKGTLTLAGDGNTVAGTTTTLFLCLDGVNSNSFTLTIETPVKTVSVGTQEGPLAEGIAGTVTFPVTTVDIPVGSYSASISPSPTGVSVSGMVTINSSGKGTLTLAGNASTVKGNTPLTLTLDGATSAPFTLSITGKIAVGAQKETYISCITSSVSFPVTTENFTNGMHVGKLTWIGVSNPGFSWAGGVNITGNTGTLTLNQNGITKPGTYTFSLTLDGIPSNTITVVVNDPPKKVAITGIPSLIAGVAGELAVPFDTYYIAPGNYTATVINLPTGVTANSTVTVSGTTFAGHCTLTLTGSAATVEGTTTTIRVTINGAQSDPIELRIVNFLGAGTSSNPYRIVAAAQMAKLAQLVNAKDPIYNSAYYYLFEDINLGVAPYNTGTGWTPIGISSSVFNGVFEGGSKTISGLTINDNALNAAGLFGCIGSNAVVKNLHLSNVNITANDALGGIAATSYGSITNCSVTGTVNGSGNIGGIVGTLMQNSISNCYSSATVTDTRGTQTTGGIVGEVRGNGTITNCYATGAVSGSKNVGGIAGYIYSGSVIYCYATGAVSGAECVGGIVGLCTGGIIKSCAALNPSVKANLRVNRIVGTEYEAYTTLDGNYALSNMGTAGGLTFGSDRGATHENGADVTAANAKLQGTWTNKGSSQIMGWTFGSAGWLWGGTSYTLPRLHWQLTPPTMPTHL